MHVRRLLVEVRSCVEHFTTKLGFDVCFRERQKIFDFCVVPAAIFVIEELRGRAQNTLSPWLRIFWISRPPNQLREFMLVVTGSFESFLQLFSF